MQPAQPRYVPAEDEKTIQSGWEEVRDAQWQLDEQRMGLSKTFFFKTYTKALDFVHVVGVKTKTQNHHPTVTIEGRGSVTYHWTTHVPRGLSQKDIVMAQYCDTQAQEIGCIDKSEMPGCGK